MQSCCTLCYVQVLSNTSYAQAARGIASALQRYAAQRHPYQRAADEVELAVMAAAAREAAADTGSTSSAAAAAAARTSMHASASPNPTAHRKHEQTVPSSGSTATAAAAAVDSTGGHSEEL
jgi:ABC-type transport system involved in cytochrome bd biosynthesis fused ATPase/permease subunit